MLARCEVPALPLSRTALPATTAAVLRLLLCRLCNMRDARFSSKAYGTHEYKEILIEGRVQFDLLQASI